MVEAQGVRASTAKHLNLDEVELQLNEVDATMLSALKNEVRV